MNPSSSCEGQSPEDHPPDDWFHLSTMSLGTMGSDGSWDDSERPERGRLKSKLVSAWNTVKYGWSFKSKARFSKTSPLTMLGQSYRLSHGVERERFRQAFATLLWLTYRRGFPQLGGSSLTTDCGWGCMLRSGQMLLAQGLLLHLLPQGWTLLSAPRVARDDMDVQQSPSSGPPLTKKGRRKSTGSLLDNRTEVTHRLVVSWFGDCPAAPFGLHQLVDKGKSSGKKAGDWYGPSIVAHILRKAVAAASVVPNLVVHVAQDCTVYIDDVVRLCERPPPDDPTGSPGWKSVIILVPVRLGGDILNPTYIRCVKNLLALEHCIGIIGGKPKHSLFFVGYQDEQLLYLDPHYSQSTVDVTQDHFPLESFHCKYPRKMAFSRMDPSCTIGFYAKSRKDFESLCSALNTALSSSTEKYPIFTIAGCQGQDGVREGEISVPPYSVTHILAKNQQTLRRTNTNNSMEEFVLL
ncbi:cysteine protease ATG4D isoform X1 [Esox lucius]|uniref:cysteine protease ATG4D isoform X1 n=1 Tax=Esox lucius TaxID=8010 RepID=UPI00147715BD|nr:cysteine protease ATG4D isoform X1 [Esox lucius]XP_019906109.2 cysteine protease ATG4D isoform X1 [Esox lucius]